jgi:lipopolysaccharide transport system permease protein
MIEIFRLGFMGNGEFDPMLWAYSFGFMIVILILGVLIFNKVEKDFMDTV